MNNKIDVSHKNMSMPISTSHAHSDLKLFQTISTLQEQHEPTLFFMDSFDNTKVTKIAMFK